MFAFKNINKHFGIKKIANKINLSINDGEILAILGPSGCGKSTLLNIAAGLVLPDSGEVWINSINCTYIEPEKRQIALMFQDYALLPHLNVWQNVAFSLKMKGFNKNFAKTKAEEALEKVGLSNESMRNIAGLSGGEQQRVALARALVSQPNLLLLDEPFSSLDTNIKQQLQSLTVEQIKSQNIPAILVTHNPKEAFEMADNIALMHEGSIIQYGLPEFILSHPVNYWAASLIGLSNIKEKFQIPQQAISFQSTKGENCLITQILPLPDYCQITFKHPIYENIIFNLDWNQAATVKTQQGCFKKFYIDQSKLIYF